MAADHTMAIFAAQLILLLFFGRLLGEGMARIGQPAIFGQLLAGVLLGPSIFGAVLPGVRHIVFPDTPALKSMIDAVSQIGILLLLLLTGMETNLALVNRKRRAVISTSLFGIAVPFVCGVALAYALPTTLIPSTATRLVTALFLGTALSVSSVKIVAMVLMEIGAIRRDLGQLILATAILDDSLAWIIIAVISGIAAYGAVNFEHVGLSIGLTALFLLVSLTVGRRVVARIIVWCNDNLVTEVPVISAILLIMLVMSFTTELIGVHSALGAFVAGILIGQSPILTEHIESQLRGFIIAFFSPVFFAVAGLGMDLRTLLDPALLGFTLAIILIASIGKFLGALAGGMLGGLNWLESLALATGLNARGSTEVIIATVGLSMGALSNQLYTMIVAMAVITTMAMPPTLRWMMGRVPLRDEELKRLEKEEAEETESVPRMERALVYVDGSANGEMTAIAGGAVRCSPGRAYDRARDTARGRRQDAGSHAPAGRGQRRPAGHSGAVGKGRAGAAKARGRAARAGAHGAGRRRRRKEAAKGYDIAFVGIGQPISATAPRFEEPLQALVAAFDGPVAILLNGGRYETASTVPLNILVPTGGSADARLATEIALALAVASRGTLTALHVFDPREDTLLLRGRARRLGISVLVEAHRLGKRSGISVKGLTATNPRPETEIRRAARRGHYDLVVLGTSLRHGETKFLGPRTLALVQSLRTPVLLIAR